VLISFLASGSKGNCTYINIEDKHMLIDIGLSMKKTNELLLIHHGIDLEDISIIMITHRHGDHIQGLKPILNKQKHIKFIIHPDVRSDILKSKGINIPQDRLIEIKNNNITGNSVSMRLFELKHDVPCFGFQVTDKVSGESYVHIADNGGWINKDILESIKGATHYAIESNHDLTLQILDTKRDALLKRRVLGGWGHTQNVVAIRIAINLATNNTKSVIFHHLSEECNSLDLITKTHDELLTIWGERTKFKHIDIKYAQQNEVVTVGE